MKTKTRIELGQAAESERHVYLDLETLIPSRLLLQATSGGGKSWALRRILEQSHGAIQQIVIDPEGEFPSLREKYDYVLVGKGGDIAAEPRLAEMLAHRLLELGASAVCDLYEMRSRERPHFVRVFLEALINAPRKLWHPVLVVVDEAHVYAPEKADSESTDAVCDLCTRGRKRGFCAILATQRLSNLNKQAAAQCFNVMIGPTSLDIDRKRAVEALGLSGAEHKRVMNLLMTREPGEFYCVGRAMSKTLTLIKVGGIETHHPEIARGRRKVSSPPPPPERVKAMLSKLADLPQAAEEDIQERAALQRRVRELQHELRRAQRAPPAPTTAATPNEKMIRAAIEKEVARQQAEWQKSLKAMETALTAAKRFCEEIAQKAAAIAEAPMPEAAATHSMRKMRIRASSVAGLTSAESGTHRAREAPVEARPAAPPADDSLRAGALRMLRTLAQHHPMVMTFSQWATLSRFAAKGGTFNTYRGELRRAGYVRENGHEVEITEAGLERAGEVPPTPTTTEERIEMWRKALRAGERKMLDALVEIYPQVITREELAERTEFKVTGGTFGTYLGVLRRNGLIEVRGADVRASETLFL